MFSLAGILGFLTGLAGPISQITNKIADLKIAQVTASSNIEKAKIEADIEEAHDRRAILVAEAGSRLAGGLNASTRLLLALGPMLLLLKVFVWDKVIGSFAGCSHGLDNLQINKLRCASFTTDGLDTNLWLVITAVIAFYFAYDMATRIKER